MSKAPSPNGLCQFAVSMLGADSCCAVQLRKPGSISLPVWRSRLLLSDTCHVDVRLVCVTPQEELTEKGTFFYIEEER